MKFLMDERLKHQLTGLIVILSAAIIFLPAMMKHSNRHFEDSMGISFKLPIKPVQPKVSIPNQNAMFQSVKALHIDMPIAAAEPSHPSIIAKAVPLSKPPASEMAKIKPIIPQSLPKVALVAVKKPAVASTANQINYGIQLATFSQQRNAEYLVERLRKQGVVATYKTLNGQQGQLYQVIAGHLDKKNDALNLQKKLAMNMQLNGYIVKTGVS